MRISINGITILIILTASFFTSYFWFSDIDAIGLDADEVVWVVHSQFYRYRQQGKWEMFTTPQEFPDSYTWSSVNYQVIDQPQLGKYIFGFILDIFGKLSWEPQEKNWLYEEFPSSRIPGGQSLQSVTSVIGPDIVQAVLTMRYVSSYVGLVSLAMFGWIVMRCTNGFLGTLAAFTAAAYPLIRYNLRIATTNSISLLFLILTVIFMIHLLKNYKTMSGKKLIMFSLLLGILNACAASIKLNGTFLVGFPVLYFTISWLFHRSRSGQRNRVALLKREAIVLLIYLMSAFLMFFLLEPELWPEPVKGFVLLFEARLHQQDLFYKFFGKRSLMTMPLFLVQLLLPTSISSVFIIPLTLLLLLGIFGLLKRKQENAHNALETGMLGYIILANTLYARIDFDGFSRYSIPSMLVMILLLSIG